MLGLGKKQCFYLIAKVIKNTGKKSSEGSLLDIARFVPTAESFALFATIIGSLLSLSAWKQMHLYLHNHEANDT